MPYNANGKASCFSQEAEAGKSKMKVQGRVPTGVSMENARQRRVNGLGLPSLNTSSRFQGTGTLYLVVWYLPLN